MTEQKVALIGGGRMGEALLAGLVRTNDVASVVVAEPDEARAADLRERYGIRTQDAAGAAAWADTVVICVKPAQVGGVLDEIRDYLESEVLVVSIAAGIPTTFLASRVPAGQPVVRVMPNTPSFVGAGMAVLSAGASARDEHLDHAEQILGTVGRVLRVDESQQDAVTAVSGSGPAYFFYVVEAMTEAGVALGLDREIAAELAAETAHGAGLLLHETGEDAAVLRAQVTSPNGTTAAAIASFDAQDLRGAFATAMRACRDRSIELGRATS